jgi:hypothetical protein
MIDGGLWPVKDLRGPGAGARRHGVRGLPRARKCRVHSRQYRQRTGRRREMRNTASPFLKGAMVSVDLQK